MKRRILIAGLAALGGLLPAGAMSQSSMEFRYPDGLVVSPLPVVPSIDPSRGTNVGSDLDVVTTGSTVPRVPVAPAGRAESDTAGRRGCAVQGYNLGAGERVRVHRC